MDSNLLRFPYKFGYFCFIFLMSNLQCSQRTSEKFQKWLSRNVDLILRKFSSLKNKSENLKLKDYFKFIIHFSMVSLHDHRKVLKQYFNSSFIPCFFNVRFDLSQFIYFVQFLQRPLPATVKVSVYCNKSFLFPVFFLIY